MSATSPSQSRQLFGTDGIRGVAGQYPLDRKTVYAIGRALGQRLAQRRSDARVLVGEDTRESSAWIASVLAAGSNAAGVEVVSAGVITTPGIAYLTRVDDFAAGIVISASHNPWQDNGIKVFGADGYKLSDQIEHEIEGEIFSHMEQLAAGEKAIEDRELEMRSGRQDLREQYAAWLATLVAPTDFSKLRVLVDCANGAASAIAPLVFADCGLEGDFTHIQPNGRNINDGCGALHPEEAAQAVAQAARQVRCRHHLRRRCRSRAVLRRLRAGGEWRCRAAAGGARHAERMCACTTTPWWPPPCRTWGWKRR